MRTIRIITGILALQSLVAQEVPLQRPEEHEVTRIQSRQFFDLITPVAGQAGRSTVQVWATVPTATGPRPAWVATGTVVDDGSKVLTKWSEVSLTTEEIFCVTGDGRTAEATVLGVYPDEDVALLQLAGAQFEPVVFSDGLAPGLGKFLVASGPEGTPYGFGVVAVEERALHDQAYLGIVADVSFTGDGVRLKEVLEEGAAEDAGMLAGDILLRVGVREVGGLYELQGALQHYSPGESTTLHFRRGDEELNAEVLLRKKPKMGGFPPGRLGIMRQMGTRLSQVADDFPVVIQTDMRLEPQQCGGPVVDLDGRVIGITIARTDRTRSFLLPASRLRMILGQEPMDPELARQLREEEQKQAMVSAPPPRSVPPMSPGQVQGIRRGLEEMGALLDRLTDELRGVGE